MGGLGSWLNGVLGGGNVKTSYTAPQLDEDATNAALAGAGGTAQDINSQQAAINQTASVAAGTGPDVAGTQLAQETANATAATNALAASGSGQAGQGQARRQAMMQGAQGQQALGGQAASAAAAEQLGGIGALNSATTAARGQDQGAALGTAGITSGMAATNAGLQAQTNQLNASGQATNATNGLGFEKMVASAVGGAAMASSPQAKTDVQAADGLSSPPDAKDDARDASSDASPAQPSPADTTRSKFAGLYKSGSVVGSGNVIGGALLGFANPDDVTSRKGAFAPPDSKNTSGPEAQAGRYSATTLSGPKQDHDSDAPMQPSLKRPSLRDITKGYDPSAEVQYSGARSHTQPAPEWLTSALNTPAKARQTWGGDDDLSSPPAAKQDVQPAGQCAPGDPICSDLPDDSQPTASYKPPTAPKAKSALHKIMMHPDGRIEITPHQPSAFGSQGEGPYDDQDHTPQASTPHYANAGELAVPNSMFDPGKKDPNTGLFKEPRFVTPGDRLIDPNTRKQYGQPPVKGPTHHKSNAQIDRENDEADRAAASDYANSPENAFDKGIFLQSGSSGEHVREPTSMERVESQEDAADPDAPRFTTGEKHPIVDPGGRQAYLNRQDYGHESIGETDPSHKVYDDKEISPEEAADFSVQLLRDKQSRLRKEGEGNWATKLWSRLSSSRAAKTAVSDADHDYSKMLAARPDDTIKATREDAMRRISAKALHNSAPQPEGYKDGGGAPDPAHLGKIMGKGQSEAPAPPEPKDGDVIASVSSPPSAKMGARSGKVEDALRNLNPYSYRYKDPANEPIPNPKGGERFFGIMTTDLKKHPVTRNLVSGSGAQEKIAIPGATSFNLASSAHLQKRSDDHEGRLSALEKMLKKGGGRGRLKRL